MSNEKLTKLRQQVRGARKRIFRCAWAEAVWPLHNHGKTLNQLADRISPSRVVNKRPLA